MNYEFVISVTAARTLSTAQYYYYSRPLCTTKKEFLRAAKSASLFLTVLFKCTTLCCKVLFQNCYAIESHRLRVCCMERCPKRYQAIPQAMPKHFVCDHRPTSITNKRRSSGPQQEQQRHVTASSG